MCVIEVCQVLILESRAVIYITWCHDSFAKWCQAVSSWHCRPTDATSWHKSTKQSHPPGGERTTIILPAWRTPAAALYWQHQPQHQHVRGLPGTQTRHRYHSTGEESNKTCQPVQNTHAHTQEKQHVRHGRETPPSPARMLSTGPVTGYKHVTGAGQDICY